MTHISEGFTNACFPPFDAKRRVEPLTAEEFETFRDRWIAEHRGVNEHRVHILAKPITAHSRFIVSRCCQAPVLQVHDWAPEVFRVLCSRCYREAGSPGREDVDLAQLVAP